jgi:hypothetical protein
MTMRMLSKKSIAALALFAVVLASGASAQERKAYRIVDANGKVTYSQTPPVDGKDAKKVDISPAQRGRGGYVGGPAAGYWHYEDPRYYAGQQSYDRYATPGRPSARDQRLAAVKAECERQRGTDCNNPAAIQYLDSTSIPRRGRYN